MTGKYDSRNAGNSQSLANPPSRFERETLHTMKQMCAASADENGFMMSYDEAIKLLQETYSGSMQVTEELRIGDWQAASHLFHGQGVGSWCWYDTSRIRQTLSMNVYETELLKA